MHNLLEGEAPLLMYANRWSEEVVSKVWVKFGGGSRTVFQKSTGLFLNASADVNTIQLTEKWFPAGTARR